MNTATLNHEERFASEYGQDAVDDSLAVIRRIAKRAGFSTRLALGVSTPHQMSYLVALCLPWTHWNSLDKIIESLGMLLLAVSVPIVADMLILNGVETIGGKAIALRSKIWAFVRMLIPVSVSGTVNFLAPAPLIVKALAAFLVVAVPLGECAKFIRIDFQALRQLKADARQAVVVETVDETAELVRQEAIAEAEAHRIAAAAAAEELRLELEAAAAERRREIAAKAAATRAENRATAAKKKADQNEKARLRREAKKLEELAPTSPGHPAVILSPADKAVLAASNFS